MSRLYPWTGEPAAPRRKKRICCIVCGWPKNYAVHRPPHGAPADAEPYDHEFTPPGGPTPASKTEGADG